MHKDRDDAARVVAQFKMIDLLSRDAHIVEENCVEEIYITLKIIKINAPRDSEHRYKIILVTYFQLCKIMEKKDNDFRYSKEISVVALKIKRVEITGQIIQKKNSLWN